MLTGFPYLKSLGLFSGVRVNNEAELWAKYKGLLPQMKQTSLSGWMFFVGCVVRVHLRLEKIRLLTMGLFPCLHSMY